MRPASSARCAALACTLALGLTGCLKSGLLGAPASIEDADEQLTSCKVAKDPLNPMIIEWPALNRTQLVSKSADGLVVVSYAGCHLKILSGCDARGDYAFRGTQPAGDKVRMASESELNAKLPLGFVDLKGKLAEGASLELDYVAVGERVASGAPAALSGACEGATHYVRAMTVGAFSLDSVASSEESGGVAVGGVGTSGGRKDERHNLNRSGAPKKCLAHHGAMSERDAEDLDCAAVLQLSLAPLARIGGGVVSFGFGAKLGPMGEVPAVADSDIRVTQTSLKDVDVAFLNLLQEAKRADKDEALRAAKKRDRWDALCAYAGKNPIQDEACDRRDAWAAVVAAERKREAAENELVSQYRADKAKLEQLLAVDSDIVSPEQKHAYESEFEQVYAPYRDLIAAAPAPGSTSGSANGDATEPVSAFDQTHVAVEVGAGVLYNSLHTNDATATFFGCDTAPVRNCLLNPASRRAATDAQTGAAVRARIGVQPVPGLLVSGLVRYGALPDWKPLTVGGGLAYRVAMQDLAFITFGLDTGYFKALNPAFEGLLAPESSIDISGFSAELNMGVSYLPLPFLSVGMVFGGQFLSLVRAPIDDPVSASCTADDDRCAGLRVKQTSIGGSGYLETNLGLHF